VIPWRYQWNASSEDWRPGQTWTNSGLTGFDSVRLVAEESGQQLHNNLIHNGLNAKNAKDTKSNQTDQPLAGLISLHSAWLGVVVVCCVNVHTP
jgi:hypothetical protein